MEIGNWCELVIRMVNSEYPFNQNTFKKGGLIRVPASTTCKGFGEIIEARQMGITVSYSFVEHGNKFDRICFYSFAYLNTLYGAEWLERYKPVDGP